MKKALNFLVAGCGLLAPLCQAEPAHKTASRAVDLEAAARATAALYATPAPAPVSTTPAAAPRSAALSAVTPAKPHVGNPRPSPLLPAAEPVASAPVVAAQSVSDVWVGSYRCELSERVSLRPGAATDQVELQWKNQRWNLRRTDSRSGAMRLEDASARMVWIQLANKSMLLDQKQGKRLLDECQHDVQVQTAAQMKNNPPPSLFDTNGMGR